LAGALIVLAELGKADFARLDALRRHHYPADHNRVPAHLTMFRSLLPSAEAEVRRSLSRAAARPAPNASIAGVMDLDSGAALRIDSADLQQIHSELAGEFRGLLTAQDTGRWTPHVTIQNKAEPQAARRLVGQLRQTFEPQPIAIRGLQLVRYVEGEWELVASYPFRS